MPTPAIHSLSTDDSHRVQKPNNINDKSIFEQAYDLCYQQPADESERKGGMPETFPETPQ